MSFRIKAWVGLIGVCALLAVTIWLRSRTDSRNARVHDTFDAHAGSRALIGAVESADTALDREPLGERANAAVAAPAVTAEPRQAPVGVVAQLDVDKALDAEIAALIPKLDDSTRTELRALVARQNAELRSLLTACNDAQVAFLTAKIDAGLADGPTRPSDSIAGLSRTSLSLDGSAPPSVSASLRRGESEEVERLMQGLAEARERWRRELRKFLDHHAR